ncbi:MAG TPA: nucleoside hydrolase-like domain-containing protein [Methylomirabilota bacterium]|nr:nucleoside hydrolase-like domain-containing protein [Methylomirabilota bacterium]
MKLLLASFWIALGQTYLACAAPMPASLAALSPDPSRLRFIIETDAGGDPDDEQSLVRFLLYVNEWDVEGIIANRERARDGENRNRERTGLGVVRALIHAYGKCWPNLVQHDPRYPSAETLLARTVPGHDDTEAAVNLIIAAVDRDDPRPVWYADWGTDHGAATNNLRRALDRVLRERGPGGYTKFKNSLRIIGYDLYADHTTRAPEWNFWVNTFQPPMDGKRWYHRFSAITAKAGGFDLRRDVLTGRGPLGALYPTNTTHWQKEGDTPTFLYLVPTGMNDPEQPAWGSWAGRYGTREDAVGKPYFWANQLDAWNGTTNRDNVLARWAADLQNDFRARLEWCVKPLAEGNHPPRVILNGTAGNDVLRFHVSAGTELMLDANVMTDADADRMRYKWFNYREAGTYPGSVLVVGADTPNARVTVPQDSGGKNFHVVVAVTDDGLPPLTRYRRAVIDARDADSTWRSIEPIFRPPAEFAGKLGAFRSPFQFQDGSTVKSAAEWTRRREEILREWHELMGPWPKVIEQLKLETLSETRRELFTQRRVRIEIAPGQTGEGWLLLPDGKGPFPAALVVYYEPETSVGLNPKQRFRDYALQLTRRGFVTLSIGTPGGNAWKPEVGTNICQPLSFHAYVAANCWYALANLPQVDRARIGVVGHSYGGKWAMFAGALWDKFAAVAVSDPGIVFDERRSNVNYWEPWYLGLDASRTRQPGIPTAANPRTGAYAEMIQRGRDLHELQALIAPRPFFVSGGAEDQPARWTALNHAVAVNQLLGVTNRVAMTNRKEHSPDEGSNARLYAFFQHFLQDASAP